MTISFRNNPTWSSAALKEKFESLLEQHHITEYRLDWWVSGEPFRSVAGPLRKAVVEAIGECLEIEPDLNTGGGTSDGRFIAPLGVEVVELGLLNESIHQVNENTPAKDLDRISEVYGAVLRRLCGA